MDNILVQITKQDIEKVSSIVAEAVYDGMLAQAKAETRTFKSTDDVILLIAYAAAGKLFDKVKENKRMPSDNHIFEGSMGALYTASMAVLFEVISKQHSTPINAGSIELKQ